MCSSIFTSVGMMNHPFTASVIMIQAPKIFLVVHSLDWDAILLCAVGFRCLIFHTHLFFFSFSLVFPAVVILPSFFFSFGFDFTAALFQWSHLSKSISKLIATIFSFCLDSCPHAFSLSRRLAL